jgi:hypothetical protein
MEIKIIMKNSNIKRSFNRSLAAIAVGACLAASPMTFADNVSGSIYGKAIQGKSVTIKNPATGFKRVVVVGEDGRFNFSKLPTGKYTVDNGVDTRNILVAIGKGSNVDFTEVSEIISIVGNSLVSIDTTSVESTSVFTAEQIDLLPVARDLTSVALLAPGATAGDSGLGNGNTASFGGSSIAENGYFINGFDVTNIRNFTSFADLPYDAVSQQQVRTGGYGAEYGRSLGGVVSLVTKRGSNEWKFGGSIESTPASFREDGKDVTSRDPDLEYSNRYSSFRSANEFDSLSYNAYASGAIVEDKLFFFGLFEGQDDESNTFGKQTSETMKDDSPMYLLKLDWNISDDHLLEMTYIDNEETQEFTSYSNPEDMYYTGTHGEAADPYEITKGGDVTIVNYTGFLTDDFSVSVLWGNMTNELEMRNPDIGPGAECELVFDRRETPSSSQSIGCWGIAQGQSTVPEAGIASDTDERDSLRLGAEWILGEHTLRVGYDQEKFTSTKRGTTFTGGEYWRWHVAQDVDGAGGQSVNGAFVTAGDEYIRHRESNTGSASYEVENTAFYIEDTWQVTDEWMVYLGLRSEGFENRNGDGDSFVKSDSELAPRLGFSWDMDGDGNKKLFGTAGRYFMPIAANTNIRAAGTEWSYEEYFYVDSADENPITAAPDKVGDAIGTRNSNGDEKAPDSRTVAATNLKPMHQDEFILGYQQQVDDWILGAKAIYREVKDGMDDYCSHQPFIDYATDNGYNDFDYKSMAGCMMMNPGNDFSIALDLNNDGNYEVESVPKEYFGLEKYKRTYKALEFTFEKPFADGWFLQGSYTLAKSEGNSEGYVNSTLEQDDAGLTQDIDNALFQDGAYGALPNDRRHTFKAFGAYQVNDEISVSVNFSLQSGRPRNCVGFIPLDELRDELGVDAGGLANYGASSFYCGGVLGNRGDQGRTPWVKNVDLGLTYKPEYVDGLTVKVNVRNAFNFQEVTEYNETGDVGSASSRLPNPNYTTPVNYQAPRRITLTARYSF